MSASMASQHAVFTAECYAPAAVNDAPFAIADRVGAACADLREAGANVTYLGALVLPDDELAFHLFIAPDASAVRMVSRRAGLRVERVMPSMAIRSGQPQRARRQALSVGDQVERPVAHAPGEIGP